MQCSEKRKAEAIQSLLLLLRQLLQRPFGEAVGGGLKKKEVSRRESVVLSRSLMLSHVDPPPDVCRLDGGGGGRAGSERNERLQALPNLRGLTHLGRASHPHRIRPNNRNAFFSGRLENTTAFGGEGGGRVSSLPKMKVMGANQTATLRT